MKFCPRCGNFVNHKYAICPKCNFDSRKIPRKNIKNIPGSKSNYHLRPTIDISKLELKIHDLTNTERQKLNLSLLSYDAEIRNIARGHSEDMSVRNFFAHETPDGKSPTDRALSANFALDNRSWFKKLNSTQWQFGENIYQTNLYDSVYLINNIPTHYYWRDLETIAKKTVDGWMNSKEHRENIVLPLWKKEGIGVYISDDDKVFITQNFN
jgi:uncharacterized protein YkwD